MDFSPAWNLNEKVIEFIFFTDKESNVHETEDEKSFERMSKYNLISGEAFYMGKVVASVKNTGYSNIGQVFDELRTALPDGIDPNTKVQVKITNIDKGLSQFYEFLK